MPDLTADPKRLPVRAALHNPWAFTCPICKKGFGHSLLVDHVQDHQAGRWGYEQVDVTLEVAMLVPADPTPD